MKENRVMLTNSYRPYPRSGVEKKKPGKVVGVIAVGNPDGFNTNVAYFTVSPHRDDLNEVVEQIHQVKYGKLPEYEQSLFYSCFKNWE